MTHQPYEEWIFINTSREKDLLTWAQRVELQKHLDNCPTCRSLFDAWRDVEQDLGRTPDIAPKSGFSRRWLDHLETQHDEQFMRTIRALFAIIGVGCLTLFIFLVVISSNRAMSPADQIWNIIVNIYQISSYFEVVFRYAIVIFGTAARTIPLSWFLLFAGVASELIVLWFLLFRVITNARRLEL